ncbi:MAG: RdgB/HAM1 family non-canonical purine NTP pyrophosphatase [Anaerolineales bacterium]|jgi:XTP/dITP diphosphohydrolase
MTKTEQKLLLGSGNPGKRREMRALLAHLPLQLCAQEKFGDAIRIPETGSTYAENAQLKAVSLARHFGIWTIADDTGLEVDALDGAPGLRSARLLASGASDAQRRARLLELLANDRKPWTARFRCVAVLASPEGASVLGEGLCEGEIIPTERGSHGFGYDAIFKLATMDKTMAELSMEEKNKLSHRARAINALEPRLRELMGIGD